MGMIPTPQENPKGLHSRYNVTKTDGSPCDPRAVYFVLRLDGFGRDAGHIAACRAAARKYAEEAPPWMKQVADELNKLLDHFDSGCM